MPYELFIGARTYSSWSLRGWLMFEPFGLPVKTRMIDLYGGNMAQQLAENGLAPARLLPVMRTPEGHVLGETLAMAEHLAEAHPDAGLWPAAPAARTAARWLVAEMHAGFTALRGACPMQLLGQYKGFEVSDTVAADLARLDQLLLMHRRSAAPKAPGSSATGPWPMPSTRRWPCASRATACPSPTGWRPIPPPCWRSRRSAAGARWP